MNFQIALGIGGGEGVCEQISRDIVIPPHRTEDRLIRILAPDPCLASADSMYK